MTATNRWHKHTDTHTHTQPEWPVIGTDKSAPWLKECTALEEDPCLVPSRTNQPHNQLSGDLTPLASTLAHRHNIHTLSLFLLALISKITKINLSESCIRVKKKKLSSRM